MGLASIIEQFGEQLDKSGLVADLRFFQSTDIRAIYYRGHVAISTQATLEEAREVLWTVCQIALEPVDIGLSIAQRRLYILHNGSVAVWKRDSFLQPSNQTA